MLADTLSRIAHNQLALVTTDSAFYSPGVLSARLVGPARDSAALPLPSVLLCLRSSLAPSHPPHPCLLSFLFPLPSPSTGIHAIWIGMEQGVREEGRGCEISRMAAMYLLNFTEMKAAQWWARHDCGR